MKKITALVLCGALILVSGGDVPDTKNDKQQSLPVEPTTSTTDAPVTSTTTPSTTTSTKTPTTSSTPSSTTSTEIPTTSTTAATTTNAPIPTTTPPVPEPSTKKWFINNTDGTLIIAKMAVQIEVVYNSTTNKTKQLSKKLDIPTDNRTEVSAEFGPYNETMTLSWKSAGNSKNSLKLHFTQAHDNKTYALNGLTVTIAPEELPDFSNSSLVLVHTAEHYNTTSGNSYRCVKLQRFNLTAENNSAIVGQLKVTDLQFQAFKSDKKTSFGYAEDCAFDTPDVVPIAVGCVLAGLVVIVLGAYLINRKRNRARGYHSM